MIDPNSHAQDTMFTQGSLLHRQDCRFHFALIERSLNAAEILCTKYFKEGGVVYQVMTLSPCTIILQNAVSTDANRGLVLRSNFKVRWIRPCFRGIPISHSLLRDYCSSSSNICRLHTGDSSANSRNEVMSAGHLYRACIHP